MEKCSICKKPIIGHSCNAWPMKGWCCTECDKTHVLPTRLALQGIHMKPEEIQEMIKLENELIDKLYPADSKSKGYEMSNGLTISLNDSEII